MIRYQSVRCHIESSGRERTPPGWTTAATCSTTAPTVGAAWAGPAAIGLNSNASGVIVAGTGQRNAEIACTEHSGSEAREYVAPLLSALRPVRRRRRSDSFGMAGKSASPRRGAIASNALVPPSRCRQCSRPSPTGTPSA